MRNALVWGSGFLTATGVFALGIGIVTEPIVGAVLLLTAVIALVGALRA